MIKAYFEILRPGINSTLQDEGRAHQNHIGVPFSGAMDNRNYLISNYLVGISLMEALPMSFSVMGHPSY